MSKRWLTEERALELQRQNAAAKAARNAQRHDASSAAVGKLARTRKLSRPRAPSETAECRAFIDWTELVSYRGRPLYDRVVKVANERGKAGVQTAILESIGMRKGFPDYIVLAPAGRWAGLYLEAKKRDGGKVDPEQIEWRDKLIEFGYHAEICAGAVELIQATQRYFELAGCLADGSYIDRTRVQT